MGQAIVSKLRIRISENFDEKFLNKKFKKYFENHLAKSFYDDKELKELFSKTGHHIKLKKYEPKFYR